MCDATTAALVISAIGTGASMEAQRKSSSQRGHALEVQNDLIQADLDRQGQQQYESAQAAAQAASQKARKDQALFDVVAGEYGGGNSTDRIRTVGAVQTSEELATIQKNSRLQTQETGFASIAATRNAQASIGTLQGPSLMGSALQIGKAYVDYTAARERQTTPKN